ncbi:hypothetical protein B0H10DRAFT_1840964 [Mycena sp. CBHHK59/15]|nr:hypothetical protein B0H10DRAFT_1840964 [Mycena sp. CBHHK59/15]
MFQQDIESTVNLQHDCYQGKCGPNGLSPIMQEHEKTSKTRSVILHTDDCRFIINTSSLHNYHQISAATPSSLRSHSFGVGDHTSLRAAAAVQIQEKITDQEELELVVPENSIIPSDPLITANDNETNQDEVPPVPQSAVIVKNNPCLRQFCMWILDTHICATTKIDSRENCTNTVLSHLCKRNNELVSGNKRTFSLGSSKSLSFVVCTLTHGPISPGHHATTFPRWKSR